MGKDLQSAKNALPVTRELQTLRTDKNIEDKNAKIEELHQFFE